MLPRTGRGFGPGGRDADETLGFRNHRNIARRRARTTTSKGGGFMVMMEE